MKQSIKTLILSILGTIIPAQAQYGGGTPLVCVVEGRDQAGQVIGTAGKAFAVRVGNRDVLVTTAHGLGEITGTSITAENLSQTFGSIALKSFTNEELGVAGRCINSASATSQIDLLAFEMPAGVKLQSMYLAPSLPPVGTKVWVLSKDGHNFSTSASVNKYPGVISYTSDMEVQVRMSAPLTAYHSSGSPIVDAKHHVIGMLCGTANDRKIVSGATCTAITMFLTRK